MRNSRGFTLIEVLLTVLITAIVVMLVHGVLISTLQASHRIDEIVEAGEIGPAILNIIRQDLEAVILPDEKAECFAGTADRIDFVTTNFALVQVEETDAKPVYYSVNEAGYQLRANDAESGYQVLYRRHQPSTDADPIKGGSLTELYDRVKSIKWEYFDEKEWRTEWSNVKNKGLPMAFRVTVVIAMRSPRQGSEIDESTYAVTIVNPAYVPPPATP